MATGRNILGGVLVFRWAMMLSARCLATAICPGNDVLLPLIAWISLIAGVLLLLPPSTWPKLPKPPKIGDEK